jgi:hypothetical protein
VVKNDYLLKKVESEKIRLDHWEVTVRCKIGSFVDFHHYFKLVHLRVGPNGHFRTLTRFK